MRKLTLILSLALSLPLALTGCGGDDAADTGDVAETTGDGDGDPSTSGDGDGDPSTGDGDGEPGDGDGEPGDGDGDGEPGDGDGEPGDGDGEPGSSGYCALGCEVDEDCCPEGLLNCPGDNYPNNYFCNAGVCDFGGCANNDDCTQDGLLPNQECHAIEDQPTCFEPCADDLDCALQPGATCSGIADDGTKFCAGEPAPGCENDADCGGYGICDVDTGECYCEQDGNCTAEGVDICVMD